MHKKMYDLFFFIYPLTHSDQSDSANWHHEHMSVRMLEKMVDENNLPYERDEIGFISDLIIGSVKPRDPNRAFLHEIVANYRCAFSCFARNGKRHDQSFFHYPQELDRCRQI